MENAAGHGPDEKLKQAYRTSYLIAGYIRQTLTKEEERELDDWIGASDKNEKLFGELTDEKNIAASLAAYDGVDTEKALLATKQRIVFGSKRRSIRFWQYTVAASFLVLAGLTIFLVRYSQQWNGRKDIVYTQDIYPGSDLATLTTSAGKQIVLERSLDTSIGYGIRVTNERGLLEYQPGIAGDSPEVHTLNVPRKGQYKLVLPDGTKVWLNSESSIGYPVAFSPSERRVKVTGETYFEIAKDASRPFRVVSGGVTTEATGTQFNVNAYPNEEGIRITLVEGGVKVFTDRANIVLSPGEQSAFDDGAFTKTNVETSTIIAWKDETFKFRNADLRSIMRQVERWYDAEVIFVDKVDVHFNATIDRSVPVSKLLEYLAGTGHVQFSIKNKIIEVRNKK